MSAGFYGLTNIAIALAGTVMTTPLAPLSMPTEPRLEAGLEARGGFVAEVVRPDGASLGHAYSQARPRSSCKACRTTSSMR